MQEAVKSLLKPFTPILYLLAGTVDVQELIAGLEGQLRKDFVKRMTKRMKRKPSQSEVDEKISEMPGGALLPVDVRVCSYRC